MLRKRRKIKNRLLQREKSSEYCETEDKVKSEVAMRQQLEL